MKYCGYMNNDTNAVIVPIVKNVANVNVSVFIILFLSTVKRCGTIKNEG